MSEAVVQTPADKVDRRIYGLVVHGVGEPKPGSTLKHVVSEFLPLVRKIDPSAGIDAKPDDDADAAEVRIHFRDSGMRTELFFREAWWAHAFEPPALGAILFSIPSLLINLARQRGSKDWGWPLCVIWLTLFLLRKLLVHLADIAIALVAIPLALMASLLAILPYHLPTSIDRVHRWSAKRAVEGEQAIVGILLVLAAPFLLVFVLMPLRFLATVLPEESLPGLVVSVQRLVAGFVTNSLGDMWIYLRRPWEASQIRTRVESRFRECVAAMKVDTAVVDSMVVIAHSMGTVVAFEALTGRRMTEEIHAAFSGEGKPRLLFVSVGSALNRAWDVCGKDERGRFFRPLPGSVNWLNIWGTSDPVNGDLVVPDEVQGPEWTGSPPSYESLRVVNQMDQFSDHTTYWNNAEQVMAPILDRATSGKHKAQLRLNEKARVNRVSVLAALKGVAWLLGPAAIVFFLLSGWGDWTASLVPSFLHGPDFEEQWWYDWLLKPAIWAIAAGTLAAIVYSTIVKMLWDIWDRAVKYKPLAEAKAADG